MVSRFEPMSLYQSDQTMERWHLVRKVVLLSLLVVAAALGFVILFRQGRGVPLVLFNLMADVGLGFLMGISTRLVLRGRHWTIQAITAAALSIVGLAVLGALTAAKSGIGPLDIRLVREHWLDSANIALWLPLQLGNSTMDLLDLAHVVIAADTSWLALRAWRRRPRTAASAGYASVPRPRLAAAAAYAVTPRPRQSVGIAPARVAVTPHVSASPAVARPASRSRPLIRQRRFVRTPVAAGAAVVRPARSGSRRLSPFRRRPAVQLAIHEDHRCPYCLEDVKRNDARGTVECPVCHTLHHKDCWDITGTCQVPHLNT